MKIQKQHFLLALLVFTAFGLCACGRRDSGIIQSRRGTGVKAEDAMAQDTAEGIKGTEIFAPEVSGEDLYVLTKLDMEQKLAVFKKAGGGKQRQYTYDMGTLFLDKYGESKSMDSFVPGDVVQIAVSGHTQHLISMQQSDQAWVYEDIVNYSFDPDSHALTIGKTKYACDPKMEIFSGDDVVRRCVQAIHQAGKVVVGSNHDFDKTPSKSDLIYRLRKMQDLGADIPKIAVMPQSAADVITLLDATQEMHTKYADRPIITMSMSGMGSISRIACEAFGSCLTFGSGDKASAPGQIHAQELHGLLKSIHQAL